MIILDYTKKKHKQIIAACARALRQGKIVAYPTDTSYGLAADSGNLKAINKLYRVKGRSFNKPVHVVAPSVSYAKKIANWDKSANRLAKKFWPGPFTLVLPIKFVSTSPHHPHLTSPIEGEGLKAVKRLSASTGFLGLRMPKNQVALDLAKILGRPITATSANQSGQGDTYSLANILRQFRKTAHKPDIIINAGKLPHRQASTVVKITPPKPPLIRGGRRHRTPFLVKEGIAFGSRTQDGVQARNGGVEILRPGPVSKRQIKKALSSKLVSNKLK